MKVGIIYECGPQGADYKVCECLAKKLCPDIKTERLFLSNKPLLLQQCGNAASQLLATGCERVLIVWDLHPAWRVDGKKQPCRKRDRDAIFQSLQDAGVTSSNVYLVCIEEELEAWLLADERALIQVLQTSTHKPTIKRQSKPDQVKNPKKELGNLFKQSRGWTYEDHRHAKWIAEAIPDFKRLRRSVTFVRFAMKVADIDISSR
jgi:hypothetical protein